jgi:hypothetical protein
VRNIFLLSIALFATRGLPELTAGEDANDKTAKLLDYYGESILPHLISSDLSWISRFHACFDLEDRVIVATKLWPMSRHDVFTSSRFQTLSAHYDTEHVWVTFARGERATLTIDRSTSLHFNEERCRVANKKPK